MNNRQDPNRDEIGESELIHYFKNESSEEERQRVEAWMTASTENKQLAEDVYKVILGLDVLNTVDEVSVEVGLQRVNRKIFSQKLALVGLWAQRTAAVLFIPLVLTFAYYLWKEQNVQPDFITFRTNPGIVADFTLPDGSRVWLNAHSELRYPSVFKGGTREVELSGEAYFQVAQDKQHPFLVDVRNQVKIEVTGTEFNVDAYERSPMISAMLVRGGIRMTYPNPAKGERKVTLEPGQKIVFDKETGKTTMSYASALVETGWKDGKVFLQNTPLEHLLHTLSKRFDVDFILENETLKDNYFTGTFGSQDLDLILKHLEFSSGIKHEIQRFPNSDLEERTKIILR